MKCRAIFVTSFGLESRLETMEQAVAAMATIAAKGLSAQPTVTGSREVWVQSALN
jgi:hypothetical protein